METIATAALGALIAVEVILFYLMWIKAKNIYQTKNNYVLVSDDNVIDLQGAYFVGYNKEDQCVCIYYKDQRPTTRLKCSDSEVAANWMQSIGKCMAHQSIN